ncbi:AMP-binding enzyme, partial [Marininema mesophilum]
RFVSHRFGEQVKRLYRTGDLARYLANGDLEYLGRIDHQVKVRGFRIELGEIEAALLTHASVTEAIVMVREDEPGDKRLVAYVIGDGSTAMWREHLKAQLPSYMVPAHFVAIEAFPLTPNGKVDHKALPAPDEQQVGDHYIAPRTSLEELVVSVWEQVLGIENIGVQDSFFELGGHSLLATQVVPRLQEVSQIELPLRELFEHSTVEALAERLNLLSNIGERTSSLQEYIQEQEEVHNDKELSDLLKQLEEMSEEESQELLRNTAEKGVKK